MSDEGSPGKVRVFGDPVYVKSRLRRVIRRGRAILDQIEGARQNAAQGNYEDRDLLFPDPAISGLPLAINRWLQSIERLVATHLPFIEANLDRSLPEPETGHPKREYLDELDEYVENVLAQIEPALELIQN